MAERRCARCGRASERGESFDEPAPLGDTVPLDGSSASQSAHAQQPWAVIDGHLVCPDCQTAEEQAEVASRVVGAIEHAVEQLAAEGADPSGPEAALIEYAMSERERLAAPVESAATLPDQAEPSGTTMSVAVTGAFLTGKPLGVPIGDYASVKRRLADQLTASDGEAWRPGTDAEAGTYASGGGFATGTPMVIATRTGEAALGKVKELLDGRPEKERAWLAERTEGWSIDATGVRVDVYDLGMAIMNGTFALTAPPAMSLSEVVEAFKRLVWLRPGDDGLRSPISEALAALAADTNDRFRRAVDEVSTSGTGVTVKEPWMKPYIDVIRDAEGNRVPPDWGRLLWLHPIHLLEVDNDRLAADSSALAPTFHRVIDVDKGKLVTGVGWSAIVTEPGSAGVNDPLGLVELHWAYIALFMEIDRGLLALLDDDRWEKSLSLKELERESDEVFASYMRVMEAQARVESHLASLGSDEQAIWDGIADVSRFEKLVEGVERKVQTLKEVAERRVQQAEAARAQRTGRILGAITALTVITVAVALTTNFLGGHSDPTGHMGVRGSIIAAALAVVAVAWWMLHRASGARRARGRRRLGRRPGSLDLD